MYILLVDYIAPLATVDALLDEHLAYLDRHYADGTFLLSGRQVPRTGGAILARHVERARLDEIIAEDPFVAGEAARYRVVEITPGRSAPDLSALLD